MSAVLHVKRLTDDERPTIGLVTLHRTEAPPEFLCFSLEDRHRPPGVKVPGDTRIPAGRYPLAWRKAGRWAKRMMKSAFPGSLELQGVPNFTDILVHAGNTKGDTSGCLLLGRSADFGNRTVGNSRVAISRVYCRLHPLMDNGGVDVLIENARQ